MKELKDILIGINYEIVGQSDRKVGNLTFDSRKVDKESVFIAQKGTRYDGHKFIPDVVSRGVAIIVCEDLPAEPEDHVTYIKVADSHATLGQMASAFYNHPSSKVKLIGITGTNGKTSIATLLHTLFTNLGYQCGLLSTIRNLVGEREVDATHTTPDSVSLNALLNQMVEAGCEFVFMEVSSHAIDQRRIDGLSFTGGVFTNITHDHLDYHKTFDAYIKAKKTFFDELPETAFALINTDDKRAQVMVQNTKAKIVSFGLRSVADFKVKVIESHFDGMLMLMDQSEIWTRLIGEFNASNLLAVYAVARMLDQDKEEILTTISSMQNVEGRFEYMKSDEGVIAIVDYAHTPDALKNVIQTINQIRTGNEQLITVVGAGGNRDKEKRPVMARIATSGSNKVILTSDNPRDEDPVEIIEDMARGVEADQLRKILKLVNRAEAIKTACMLAAPGDIILVAGKGHETYQEIKGVKTFFSDRKVLEDQFLINNRN